MDFPVRINKFLAACGLGSRRYCETLISEGKIRVNGQIIKNLGTQVNRHDSVMLDRKKLEPRASTIVFAYNKPKGVLCSTQGQGKVTLYDVLPKKFKTLHYVGRLDFNSRGLLLLTNDGDLTQKLTNPKFGYTRKYRVKVKPELQQTHKIKLEKGVIIDKAIKTGPCRITMGKGFFEIELKEGKNREIRKMMEKFRYSVMDLERISFGPILLEGLLAGKTRILSRLEIDSLISQKKPIKK